MQLRLPSTCLQPPHASEVPAAIVLFVVCVSVTDVMPLGGASRNRAESIGMLLLSSSRIPESSPVPLPNVLFSAVAHPASAAATNNHLIGRMCPGPRPLTIKL